MGEVAHQLGVHLWASAPSIRAHEIRQWTKMMLSWWKRDKMKLHSRFRKRINVGRDPGTEPCFNWIANRSSSAGQPRKHNQSFSMRKPSSRITGWNCFFTSLCTLPLSYRKCLIGSICWDTWSPVARHLVPSQ